MTSAYRALLRLQLETQRPQRRVFDEPAVEVEPPSDFDDGGSKSGCDHEWEHVEPNPDSTRTIRVCGLCGLAASPGEDREDDS